MPNYLLYQKSVCLKEYDGGISPAVEYKGVLKINGDWDLYVEWKKLRSFLVSNLNRNLSSTPGNKFCDNSVADQYKDIKVMSYVFMWLLFL